MTLSSQGKVLHEVHLPVRLLARDEWRGMADMAQLPPARLLGVERVAATSRGRLEKAIVRRVLAWE